jgi:hypothetical protein
VAPVKGTAVISDDGLYRYLLTRDWTPAEHGGQPATVTFLMLNPSTADADVDDATIRRCRSFATQTGHTRLQVVNLYAFRATKPADLWRAEDPVGTDNPEQLRKIAAQGGLVVAGWGAQNPPATVRSSHEVWVRHVREFFGDDLWCLGANTDGSPKHPLYLPNGLTLMRWPISGGST